MTWKERVYASLPYVLVLLAAVGVIVTNEVWAAIVGLIGMWFLPTPLNQPNVSRETSEPNHGYPPNVITESNTGEVLGYTDAPCHVMHGSADPHVLGCKGWANVPH